MLSAEIGTYAVTLVTTGGRSRTVVQAGLFHLLFDLAIVTAAVLLVDVLAGFSTWARHTTELQIAIAMLP
jgi:hypothetical protein